MPLETLLGPVGDLYCFSNTFRMLVRSQFLTDFLVDSKANSGVTLVILIYICIYIPTCTLYTPQKSFAPLTLISLYFKLPVPVKSRNMI